MSKSALHIVKRVSRQWQWLKIAEALLYALGVSLFVSFLTHMVIAVGVGLVVFGVFIWLFKPWLIRLEQAAGLIDAQARNAEHSTTLLLTDPDDLTLIGRLQRKRITDILATKKVNVKIPHHLYRGFVLMMVMAAMGWALAQIVPLTKSTTMAENQESPLAADSTQEQLKKTIPLIEKATVKIAPPAYSGLPARSSGNLNIKSLQGSLITWELTVKGALKAMKLEMAGGRDFDLKKVSEKHYRISTRLRENGYYNFKLLKEDEAFTSDLYQLEAVVDLAPEVAIENLEQHTYFSHDEDKKVLVKANLSDDYGLDTVRMVATVSKGSGESVKFREEVLSFDNRLQKGAKSAGLNRAIDLKAFDMTPGDELYFYVEVADNKRPESQWSRTETYFLTIRDTTSIEFSLAGSLGVDLMPEYFRSQRQIIIDTEKLIKQKGKLSKKQFNSTSNELGFDQKALRLKYGQFMGVEDESGIAIETEEQIQEELHEESQDPLSEYTHDHDGDNEHNLVADGHDHESENEEEGDDPLDAYVHDHDDPEEATLYTASLRSKLKQAMAEMWDAELYLRLYEPHNSLPYQYRALKLIKEIKNHARIYVHRIGFDPPPIKEENRLTGDLDEVKPTSVDEKTDEKDDFINIKKAISLINAKSSLEQFTAQERSVFEAAGNELSALAIKYPGRYLATLQYLKKLAIDDVDREDIAKVLRRVNKSLYEAVPADRNDPAAQHVYLDDLTRTYLQKLADKND